MSSDTIKQVRTPIPNLEIGEKSACSVWNFCGSASFRVKLGEKGKEKARPSLGWVRTKPSQPTRRTSDAQSAYHRAGSQPPRGDSGAIRVRRTAHSQARDAARWNDSSGSDWDQ